MTKHRSTEHGLLMSGPMALAAYRGVKTQTRRPLAPQPYQVDVPRLGEIPKHGFWVWQKSPRVLLDDAIHDFSKHCPYGRVGDRVYVRETWRPSISHHCYEDACDCGDVRVWYAAGGSSIVYPDSDAMGDWTMPDAARTGNLPSIHMPKWASRTWGTIASVRVEMVQSISEADAIAEGVEAHDCDGVMYYGELDRGHIDPRVEFRRLWDSLYSGELSWVSNPWVWVVEWEKETLNG